MKLLPHQKEDSDKMASGDLPNFSEAGTGKTYSTLAAIQKAGVQGGLVLGPTISLPMWENMLKTELGADVQLVRTGSTHLWGCDFYVTSFGIASNPAMKGALTEMSAAMKGDNALIIDESHYLKNLDSKRTRAVYGPRGTGEGGLFAAFDISWPLSGTPIMKYSDDVWTQVRATHPHVLEKYGVLTLEKFRAKFCVVQRRQFHPRMQPKYVVVANKNEDLLNQLLYETMGCVRRSMDEVKVYMPPLNFRKIEIALDITPVLRQLAKEIGDETDENSTVMAEALHVYGMCKVAGSVDYIVSLQKQVLVGYWHSDVGDALEEALKAHGTTARVRGGMTMDQKEAVRVAFNDGAVQYLVGQLSSMNESWNLQESGNHVCIVEDNFSPGIIEQFIKRVWRIGQGNPVQADMLKGNFPLDDMVTNVRERKEKSNKVILG